MANDENLKGHEFEPGESGNPSGRPKGAKSLSTLLRKFLAQPVEVPTADGRKEKMEFQEAIVRKLLHQAAKGREKSISIIFDRTEGKAPQFIDVTSDGEPINQLQHEVTFLDYSGKAKPKKRKPRKK